VTLLEKTSHGLVVVGCAYEIAALVTRSKTPTISALCRKHRWLEGMFLAGLVVHFHYKYKESECLPSSMDATPDISL
jgi:hypothetical protein